MSKQIQREPWNARAKSVQVNVPKYNSDAIFAVYS